MRTLTPDEQLQLRQEMHEREKEANKLIGVYLSALVVVVGWVVNPSSKGILALALGNDGFNIFGLLIVVVVNIIFLCFLIEKSLRIHEVTQFVASSSPSDSGFTRWESWRHDEAKSVTKPIRAAYTVMIALAPTMVSVVIMSGLGWLLWGTGGSLDAQSLAALQRIRILGRAFWVFLLCLHFIPAWFFYLNAGPTLRKWEEILRLEPPAISGEATETKPAAPPEQEVKEVTHNGA
jgi:hypothetical protein